MVGFEASKPKKKSTKQTLINLPRRVTQYLTAEDSSSQVSTSPKATVSGDQDIKEDRKQLISVSNVVEQATGEDSAQIQAQISSGEIRPQMLERDKYPKHFCFD